jgi:hypothetical protein
MTKPVTFPWEGRACSPDSTQAAGCVGDTCTVTVPPPYRVCVAAAPSRICPPNSVFTQQNFELAAPSASCGWCDCSVNANCSGTVELFSDTQCGGTPFDIPADGQCHPAPPGIGSVNAYKYVPNAATDFSCAPLGPPVVMTSGTAMTICCTQ